ncbi:MAG TPA: hypothetical protein VL200_03895 [Lacunisphaera sp.]|jgi:hypothetical protein|nr:hypothetical protein [Lacunisphaera sp.]
MWRGLKLLLSLTVLAAGCAMAWVVLLPGIVTSAVRTRTGFSIQLAGISANPFTGRAAIRGLVLRNPSGWPVADFAELREFRAEVNLLSLLGDRFIAEEIVVDLPRLTLVVNERGAWNAAVFKEGLAGAPPAGRPAPKQEFLIRHLVVRFDQLVYADYSGSKPDRREFNLALRRDLHDVDSVTKIVSPFTGTALGIVSRAIGGMFKDRPDVLTELASPVRAAGTKTGEKLKGLLDSLDKRRP